MPDMRADPWMAGVFCALAACAAATLRARSLLLAVRIHGPSMEPTFHDGDMVLVVRGTRRLRRGRVVVFHEPPPPGSGRAPQADSLVVKRIAATAGESAPPQVWPIVGAHAVVPEGAVIVLGDNPAGVDSRTWGYIPQDSIVGLVLRRR